MAARAEFTVEPFVEGNPGPHVTAALDAVRRLGFDPEIGPFATEISGPAKDVSSAVCALIDAAGAQGATRISVQVDLGTP